MIKITNADKWFSKCVREAADWSCEVCGTKYAENAQGLHCSHFFGRRNYSVRFCSQGLKGVNNAFSHCYSCHQKMGSNPYDFAKWVENEIGADFVEILIEKRNDISAGKMIKKNLKEVAAHYKLEYEKLKARRAAGEKGKLSFTCYL